MTCYYCGDCSFGCAECRVAATIDFVPSQPVEVPDLVVKDLEAFRAIFSEPAPDRPDTSYSKSVLIRATNSSRIPIPPCSRVSIPSSDPAWFYSVSQEVTRLDSRVTVELVTDPTLPSFQIWSRTRFENQPLLKQQRCQSWAVSKISHLDSHLTAQYIVDYWEMSRKRADAKLEEAKTP